MVLEERRGGNLHALYIVGCKVMGTCGGVGAQKSTSAYTTDVLERFTLSYVHTIFVTGIWVWMRGGLLRSSMSLADVTLVLH